MKFLLLLFISFRAQASLPELFGPSAGTMALGNQPEKLSAANNYYAAALLGYSEKLQFSFNAFYLDSAFNPIHDIVIKNQTNTVNSSERGNIKTNSSPTTMFSAHLSTPLFAPTGPKFNLSIVAPLDRMIEANTGDPYQPRYVMYDNRFIRPSILLSLAQSFSNWSFSIGGMSGFQSNGETYLMTRTTSGNPSLGKISFNAKPSLGFLASVSKKDELGVTYFAFQQEMKSKLAYTANGETEIASNASFPFDFKVSSLLYFDPMTLRLGRQLKNLHFSVEYQNWKTYQGTTLKLKKQGGVINGSENYEKLDLQNIFIPKIGHELKLTEKFTLKTGYFYRPSPLKTNNLKNAGNSIDVDKHVVCIGAGQILEIYNKDVTLDFAYQAHFLKSQKITKTDLREDGDPSQPKIGSPGYRVGGMIHALSLGLTWMY